ncbi:Uncharacterized protein PRO82_000169 [Candidatus Protochlamydia amoebophila]|uniref:hypothetical protein n=1 Tax=Candidatus Protochlamydia amoebophila TaxID=362787 RepID=UPI001BC8E361|nr:hypothetical protein [Candidatus Protochlamydia amoebophila]MBS4162891.1 Uncharacterized protein [Candidatus Protochlamydia amoebophila]
MFSRNEIMAKCRQASMPYPKITFYQIGFIEMIAKHVIFDDVEEHFCLDMYLSIFNSDEDDNEEIDNDDDEDYDDDDEDYDDDDEDYDDDDDDDDEDFETEGEEENIFRFSLAA